MYQPKRMRARARTNLCQLAYDLVLFELEHTTSFLSLFSLADSFSSIKATILFFLYSVYQ